MREIAAYLRVSHQRVTQMYTEGKLPKPEQVNGIGPLSKPATIERWARGVVGDAALAETVISGTTTLTVTKGATGFLSDLCLLSPVGQFATRLELFQDLRRPTAPITVRRICAALTPRGQRRVTAEG
jgi:hypothetical protein